MKILTSKALFYIVLTIVLLSFLGFVDATYLTVEHYRLSVPSCGLTGGCEKVLFSSYSEIAGVPVALGGVFYYLSIFLLSIFYLDQGKKNIIRLVGKLSLFGFLASAYFVYLQIFIIKSFCQYCLLSAITSTVIFFLGLIILFKTKEQDVPKE